MNRKTKLDWLEAGTNILMEVGAGGLTIDALTARLGVTKGSFYHHFKSYQDYKETFLTFAEEKGTLEIIQRVEQFSTPAEKLIRLLESVAHDPPGLEVAIRAWALQDETVRGYQERVDGRRMAYLQEICRPLAGDEAQTLTMAQLLYAIYVGSQHIIPPIREEALVGLFQEFKRLYALTV